MSFGSMSFSALGDSLGRFLQPAATVVAVFLFAWAAWLAAQMTWNLLAPANPPTPSATVSAATGSGGQLSPERIQRMHLFGERGAQPAQTARTTEAPETTLNIRLVGVTASTVPERSAAIIQQGNNQVVYIPGETISSSRAVLREILSDRVILENAGRMETLYLDGRDGFEPGLTLREAPAPRSDASTPVQPTEVPLSGQEVSIESIQELVTITPYQQDGELVGYRLAPRANPEIFTAAGFQAGDIAISLNGYDLTNVAEAASIMRDLSSLTTATVVVLRNGEQVTLELSIPNE
ncbi:type II secretion system protein GspC [Aliidiomarina sanyensis]|nr:type II secretion system protein GspC [Aliidiomarina sanyensis]